MSHEMQRSWTLQEPVITQRVDVHGHTMAFNEAIRDFIFQDRDTRSPFPPAEDLEAWLKDDEVAAWKRFSFCKPTWEGVGAFLGPGPHESGCHPILNVFSYNLFHPAISVGRPVINTVEDVKRDFYQNFEYMVRSGFSTGPFMTSRSDVPVDTTLPTESCIYRLTWPGRIDQLHEKSAMIGLFRKPGTIKPSQWEGSLGGLNQQIDASTRKLQQNIREYAHHYDCPHIFVFDSDHLLIVQIRAGSREQLKNPNTRVDYCVIPHNLDLSNEITMQSGLYLLAWRGWMRLSATMEARTKDVEGYIHLELEGSNRVYEYWSGRPMWETAERYSVEHPKGWRRKFEFAKVSNDSDSTNLMEESPAGRRGYWIWDRPGRRAVADTGNVFQ